MLSADRQRRLTEMARGTPMGELLRRYWYPVAAVSELERRPVKRVRLLGENFALYRTADGAYGLLDERCPHRGASLGLGFVDADGLRCPYHGWKFDAAGRCLDTPAEPPSSRLRERVRCAAYRAEALGGLVFAYVGPEPAPLLPRYDLFVWDDALRDIGHALVPCHWLQIMENSVDPVHVEWLHGRCAAAQARDGSGADVPERYLRRHREIGFERFAHGIVKRRLLDGGSKDDDDWKTGHPLVFPAMLRVGAGSYHSFQIRVPVDEAHTWHVWYSCVRLGPDDAGAGRGEIPFYEVPLRDGRGEWRLDFVDGQDVAVWVSQGAVADRTRERLGDSDRGVVLYRRMLLEEMERARAGADPCGVMRDPAANRIVELPQEPVKYGDGPGFRRESMTLGHLRFSPAYEQLLKLAERSP